MTLIQCANGIHLRADQIVGVIWKRDFNSYSINILLKHNSVCSIGNFDTKIEAENYADQIAKLVNQTDAEETS